MKNKGNAKAMYSKNQILEALLKQMEVKEFDDITIKELAESAMVSRTIFQADTFIDNNS